MDPVPLSLSLSRGPFSLQIFIQPLSQVGFVESRQGTNSIHLTDLGVHFNTNFHINSPTFERTHKSLDWLYKNLCPRSRCIQLIVYFQTW
jgi:hypothetical protein